MVLTAKSGIAPAVIERAFESLKLYAPQVDRPEHHHDHAVKICFSGEKDLPRNALSWVGTAAVDVNFVAADQAAPKLFIADMDSTMIGQECIDELADYAGVKSQIAEITEAAMQGKLDFEAALRERVKLLSGLDVAVLEQCYAERIAPNEGAVELLKTLENAGVRRVLVSGGFTFFARKIAERLGFDRFVANEFEIADGKLTGGLIGKIVDRAHKATVLHEEALLLGILPAQIVAIGDGANDLDMIKAAGIGVAYRAKPALDDQANIRLRHSALNALVDILEI